MQLLIQGLAPISRAPRERKCRRPTLVAKIESLALFRSDSACCMCRFSAAARDLKSQSSCTYWSLRQHIGQSCRPLPIWACPLLSLPLPRCDARLNGALKTAHGLPQHASFIPDSSNPVASRSRHAYPFQSTAACAVQTAGWKLRSSRRQSANTSGASAQPASPATPRPVYATTADADVGATASSSTDPAASGTSSQRSASVRGASPALHAASASPSQRQVLDRLLLGGPLRSEEPLLRQATAQRLNFSMQVGAGVKH